MYQSGLYYAYTMQYELLYRPRGACSVLISTETVVLIEH